jgi:hypothetical protein
MIAQLLATCINVVDLRVMPFKFSLMGRFQYNVRGGLDVCNMIEAEAPSNSITTSGCGSNIYTSNASSKLGKCFSTMMHYVADIVVFVLILTSYASLLKG